MRKLFRQLMGSGLLITYMYIGHLEIIIGLKHAIESMFNNAWSETSNV